ncbi:MAG: two-component regulator propeller domain-containing protein [Dysgonomonas sp.]|nr:two-component regulator propeller domain-containing protein [Dysgonomonas sp.]
MFLRLIVLYSFVWNISSVFCQNTPYYFKHITSDEGLSQNAILSILQDRQGFMWFATKDGVNRYDGITFRTFSTDNTNGEIQDCVINSLCETQDGKIWLGTNKGVCTYDPEKESFTKFNIHPSEFDGEIRREIKGITEDSKGKVWICDFYRGIYCYDPSSGTLKYISLGANGKIPWPFLVFEDKNGEIWVGTNNDGIYKYNIQLDYFEPYFPLITNNIDSKNISIKSIVEIGQELYIGTYMHGLLKLNLETHELTEIKTPEGKPSLMHILTMEHINDNEIWICTDTGLYIYDRKLRTFTNNIRMSYVDKFSLSNNFLCSIYKDKDNGIWVGSYFGGINYLPYKGTTFNKYYPLNDYNTISGKVVRDILEDKNGIIWIATEDAGLNRFDPETREFKSYNLSAANNDHDNIQALCLDDDKLWVSVYTKGLILLDTKTEKIKHYGQDKISLQIYSLHKDKSGNIWAGNTNGAYIYDKETDRFKKFEEVGNFYFNDIKEDYLGNIWLAAISNGVVCYNPTTKSVTRHINDPNNPTSIATKATGIFEDSMKRLWFVTEGWGFCRFDRSTNKFKRYTIKEGLPNSVIHYITEDSNGLLWLGTNKGLVQFNPETEEINVYTQKDGLLCEQFNFKSALTSRDGTIYMGSLEGMISFDPSTFKKKEKSSFSPVLTSFQIFNDEVQIGERSPLNKSISLTERINLNYKQNSLSFDFAPLNYNLDPNHLFYYRLEDLESEWHIINENQKISYSNLSPGNYVLRVKDPNSEKEGCSLQITIKPPIWMTPYAYILYIIFVILLLFYIYKKSTTRIKFRYKQDMIKLKAEKERETYNAKISFFTNVAHEVRTPLSLIKGPLEGILKKENLDNEIKQDLLIMQRNSDRLLTLINQLLDFRKTESGKFSLSFRNENIIDIINELHERFLPIFRQKNLEVKLKIQREAFYVDIDKEAFTKIISNLFINASKHARKYIEIELLSESKPLHFSIIVKNDGDIIKDEMFEKVFEPFFQANNENNESMTTGTGIGLSLSRNLAELHNGELYIQKESDEYNKFILELPINQTHTLPTIENEDPLIIEQLEETKSNPSKEQYKIVIVEDNIEMLSFITKELGKSFNILTALNGKEALKILDKTYIDLIISDISMPEMDGFELLRNIKSNIKYSHIPIILLTARTSLESKIEGLNLGADAYIEKPFSIDFLLVQINNLLDGRKKLKDSFNNSPYLYSNTIALTKADEEFMEKVNDVIEQNMDNIEFNIGQLSYEMNVSHSSLLRKIKGISGLTVNEYIRLFRLKKAAALLEENKYRINEICTLTGFNNPSYFTKCFYKQFGILPKDFISKEK